MSGPMRILRNPNFLRLWLGQTVSFIGDYFYFLAIPIMVNNLTHSTAKVGLSFISSAVPMVLLGPVAGVFVDRWNRQRTMIVADVLRGLLVLLCLLVQRPEQVWIYYLAGFLMSCVSRFFFPAQNALLPRIVGEKSDDLLAANSLMQAVQMVGLIAGPALAGVTIGLWGAQVAFIFDSVSFFFSALCIWTMLVPRRMAVPLPERGQMAAFFSEFWKGVTGLFGSPTMVMVLACMTVVQFALGAVNVIWVPFLQGTFEVGAEGLGLVDGLQGAGMVISGLAVGFLAARFKKSALIGWGLVAIGLVISGIGLAPTFFVVLLLSFAIGLALTPAQSALATVMQLAIPDEKRGRVGSAMNAITMVGYLASMMAATFLGDLVGLRPIYIVCGLILAASGLLGLRIPEPAARESASNRPVASEGAGEGPDVITAVPVGAVECGGAE